LRLAHIDGHTPDPAGGHIERDAKGLPTGTLRDNASDRVFEAVPPLSATVETDNLLRAFADMHAVGITSVQDAAVDEHLMSIYRRLLESHRLTMRVRACYRLADLHEAPNTLIEGAVAFRKQWSLDEDFLRADAVKIFADGVVETPSRTASLLEPYLDEHGHPTTDRGPAYFEQSALDQIVSLANAANFTVHIHAIGDRAVRSALDAFAYSRAHNGAGDTRDQIAHLELVDPADVPRFEALGVLANYQFLWFMADPYITKATIPYLGEERARHLYAARSLLTAGATLVGGSDWNVSSFNPFEAMERAITRSEARGKPALLPAEAIDIETVVAAYTIHAAYALRQEQTTGSLEVGKRADLIVLDRDIFGINPYELHNTRVLSTYVDGREVYHAKDPAW
jgi:predicted amidohydrolase YtcJ